MDIKNLSSLAKKAETTNKKFFARLKKSPPRNLDETFHQLHDEAFTKINCMDCANCCKTTSPVFKDRDIERLADHFRIKPIQFIEKYLHIDEDNDYVLNTAPCPFLADDNSCTVYEARPNACREYPHTDKRKMHRFLDLTLKNTAICPAVYEIVEELKTKFI